MSTYSRIKHVYRHAFFLNLLNIMVLHNIYKIMSTKVVLHIVKK
ncbi:DUF547 domain-containing protein [Acinetobacter wuhouensis]|uniref:DUF547 domain-containing protein n=1 Tax=Acinetobacter wuhouensis TaxID=1879050 RepID=A0A4Q7AJT2_9GAMM|nr:DUF547 domain-containing protein [Acinetobacter wuhouensis]